MWTRDQNTSRTSADFDGRVMTGCYDSTLVAYIGIHKLLPYSHIYLRHPLIEDLQSHWDGLRSIEKHPGAVLKIGNSDTALLGLLRRSELL
jgi:hypothetical protein